MSVKELERQYKEMYDLVFDLVGIIKTAFTRIEKLEEKIDTEEISEG